MALTQHSRWGGSVFLLFLTGCALFSDESESIKLTSVRPDARQCRFIAQAVGQGGGDIIPPSSGKQSMREDAVDNIRAIAHLRGGNVVYVVESQNHNFSDYHEEIGTIIGEVYRCQ